MSLRFLAAALWIAALGGCGTPSLHSICTTDKEISEPGLVGSWRSTEEGDQPTYIVSKASEGYHLLVKGRDPKKAEEWGFELRLIRLGPSRFLNVGPTPEDRKKQEVYTDPQAAGPDFAVQGEYVGKIPGYFGKNSSNFTSNHHTAHDPTMGPRHG